MMATPQTAKIPAVEIKAKDTKRVAATTVTRKMISNLGRRIVSVIGTTAMPLSQAKYDDMINSSRQLTDVHIVIRNNCC
jgi:hypothetical protein